MQEDLLRGILLRHEDERTEFKIAYHIDKGLECQDEVAKYLVALANAAGRSANDLAYLVIGAGDARDASGKRPAQDVRSLDYSAKTFLDIVNSRCYPPLKLMYEVVEVDGHTYGLVTITPSPDVHPLTTDLKPPKGFWRKHSVLTRIGDEVQVASPQEFLKMYREIGRAHV